ncbi:uncharacterized protein LOC120628567 [Pararge aegeria]|uniref:Jg1684 protein n=2 Tax=Pararge aegeria TaxID=116150 RepID=A0A8S4RCS2_9NEOP|nr:uncharacterized protein LOC120628567 [Pararge aegeria]CAH2234544.1 jg1684 [Pararge aegeria aegeria]CAH2234547.1 jg1687 [Pararge aegeria aegeria]
MDINMIIEGYLQKASILQEAMPKLSLEKTISNNAFAEKRSDWQKDALLAVKRDPAVLEAKVTVKDQSVFNSLMDLEPPKKPTGFQPRNTPEARPRLDFDNKMCMERAALLSLSSTQFSLLLKYVDTLRQQRMSSQKQIECGFCKNNRQPEVWYTTHALKDAKGRVRCPILRSFVCPQCGSTGDRAHTISHCPRRK